MLKLMAFMQAYKKDTDGATAIEYGLIAAGISLAIAVAVGVFGDQLAALFETFGERLNEGTPD